MTTAVQPAKRFRLGSITVSLWPNSDRSGRTFYTTTITRSYRDKQGKWGDTASLRPADLPTVKELTAKALEWITANPLHTAQRAEEQNAEPEPDPEPALDALCALIEKQFSR